MIKHFIDISDFNKSKLNIIISLAKKIKNNPNKYKNLLQNKSLGIFFEKQSARTRTSFEIGMKNIGGNVIAINKNEIGFGKRESESDIIKTLSQYIDCLVIRNNNHNKIKLISKLNHMPIINGLSNFSHPCQILSDIFTIKEFLGPIEKKIICWVGDINNISIPLMQISKILKFKLNIASPEKILLRNKTFVNKYKSNKVNFYNNPFKAVKNADCVMTDVWKSMGEKNSFAKKKLFHQFQINEKLMKYSNKNAIFMHCLPAHRNQEVTDSVIDGKQSVVWQQAKNRMYVQQAILSYCIT